MNARISMAAAIVVTTLSSGAIAAELGKADIFVLHGIDGRDLGLGQSLPVDVDVAETPGCDIRGLTFGQGLPDSLPALKGVDAPATYRVKVSLSDGAPCSGPTVIDTAVPVLSGQALTVVAHLNESGQPTATAFNTNTTMVSDNSARLTVHHTAFAPVVDVVVEPRGPLVVSAFQNLANGDQDSQVFQSGNRSVSIEPRGTNVKVFGPTHIGFASGGIYAAYAVGSVENNTFTVLVQTPEGK